MQLAEELNAKLLTLDSDCGHRSFACEADKVKKAITAFLE
jgi:homoserine acetyltransferase